jgi:hypothetical protein
MENVPATIAFVFGALTLLSLFLLLKAARWSRPAVVATLAWTILLGAISLTGFFTDTSGMPPRFAPVLVVPLLAIAVLFLTRSGRAFIANLDQGGLMLVHAIRIPVELVLFGLFVHGAIPELMTFTGRNWDILSGLTAPLIWWLGYRRRVLPRAVLIGWNMLCLALLFNIVINAILAAPFDFQQQAFDRPNIAIFHFPYILLPGVVVPIVLFSHLVLLRSLVTASSGDRTSQPLPVVRVSDRSGKPGAA